MRVEFPTASRARVRGLRHARATVENSRTAVHHLSNPNFCPIKRGQLCFSSLHGSTRVADTLERYIHPSRRKQTFHSIGRTETMHRLVVLSSYRRCRSETLLSLQSGSQVLSRTRYRQE